MRHLKKGRKLGRNSSHRKALKLNLLKSLFTHRQIITTLAKAKEYGREADKLITYVKKAEKKSQQYAEKALEGKEVTAELQAEVDTQCAAIKLAYFRRALSILQDKELVQKLFYQVGPAYMERNGGYTRVIRVNKPRLGDNATRALLALVDGLGEEAAPVDENAETVVKEKKKADKERLKEAKAEKKRQEKERKEQEKEKERQRKEKEKERLRKEQERKQQMEEKKKQKKAKRKKKDS